MTKQSGFTYLFVLILLTASGAVLLAAANRWADQDQRSREVQLLRIGDEIRAAIGAYYESTPGTVKKYPPNLDALLVDSRFLNIRRYLRRIPLDPITNRADWTLIPALDGGVKGVTSPSDKVAFKAGNFAHPDVGLAKGGRYSDWEFSYVPDAVAGDPKLLPQVR